MIDETLMQKITQFANNDGNQCSMVVHQQLSLNTILNECSDDAGTSVQVWSLQQWRPISCVVFDT